MEGTVRACGSVGMSPSQEGLVAVGDRKQLRAHMLNHEQEAEKANLKCHKSLHASSNKVTLTTQCHQLWTKCSVPGTTGNIYYSNPTSLNF